LFKKILIASFFLGFSTIVVAQPEKREAFGADDQNNYYYLETDNMARRAYVVFAWQQINRAQADDQGALFNREQIEFDCNFKRYRKMWTMSYTEQDGRGRLLNSQAINNPEWQPVVADSIAANMLKFACVHVFRPR
jgi:hypothetical protein